MAAMWTRTLPTGAWWRASIAPFSKKKYAVEGCRVEVTRGVRLVAIVGPSRAVSQEAEVATYSVILVATAIIALHPILMEFVSLEVALLNLLLLRCYLCNVSNPIYAGLL